MEGAMGKALAAPELLKEEKAGQVQWKWVEKGSGLERHAMTVIRYGWRGLNPGVALLVARGGQEPEIGPWVKATMGRALWSLQSHRAPPSLLFFEDKKPPVNAYAGLKYK
jgi:hypothetical protein